MKLNKSESLFDFAQKLMPGGVSSPVRAFKSVGGTPIFMKSGNGAIIIDEDGNKYVDYVASWGPLILGHANRIVIEAIERTAENGTSFGACTFAEIELAKLIVEAFPSIEKVRFVNSGTEAVMSAIRVARAYTGREKIIKFDGCYHGHYDNLLVKAGSGLATFGISSSLGIPADTIQNTITLPYNNIEIVRKAFERFPTQIASIIIEPVAANMGLVLPEGNFLQQLEEICKENGTLLIFDEVITGFRLCYGGAQTIYSINPDITILGKIIGGGLPVGAYGGKKEIMDYVAPIGNVYQAGTLSGNPVAMNAGIATLKILKKKNYEQLSKITENLTTQIEKIFKELNIGIAINRIGSMFTFFFLDKKPKNFEDVMMSNTILYSKFFWALIKNGVYFPPSQFEVCFVSFAHKDNYIKKTIKAVKEAAMEIKCFLNE